MTERYLATVGSVYDDGITLIFEGETTETQKRYMCNTSAQYRPGDRVKIAPVDGTYIVEYVIGRKAIPPSSGESDFAIDNHTLVEAGGVVKVNTAPFVEQDNTLPITSAAVYTEVGNINALLATI